MAIPALLIGAIVALYLAIFAPKRWMLNPAPLFAVVHTTMLLGALPLLDLADEVDALHLWVLVSGLLAFLVGAIAASWTHVFARARRAAWWAQPVQVEDGRRFRSILLALGAFSVVVTIVYYQLVGYNIFLLSLSAFITGSDPISNVGSLRLQAYSGDRYLAPGYVNQFKNIFLPLITTYFALRFALKRERRDAVVAAVGAPIAIAGLLGTGQRTAFIVAALIALFAANATLPRDRVRRINVLAAVAIPVFILVSTAILGRTTSRVGSGSDLAALVSELVTRVTRDQQIGSVVGFRYIANRPIAMGTDWIDDLAGVLPGRPGSSLPHEVFALMYGTDRGTAPISLWDSIWYNFGFPGVIVIAIALGFAYERAYQRLYRGPRSLFRLLAYAAASIILGMWVAGTPATLLNTGLVAVVVVHTATRRFQRTARWASHAPSSPFP